MSSIFITGGAGFIGFHLQNKLHEKFKIDAIDTLNYQNKAAFLRAQQLNSISKASIHDDFLQNTKIKPSVLIHLAAETGIPGSISNPQLYVKANVEGTFNVLEQCRNNGVKYLIYASSSSVYEPNQSIMHENSKTENQLSFYGTTKKMCEVMVENYCHQFGITAIGLRFFTVYGSWTRPDMAAYKFMKNISEGKSIKLYNDGNVMRDFTHVSDIVNSIEKLIDKIKTEPLGKHEVFNIGFGQPVSVKQYAELIANNLKLPLYFDSAILPSNELVSTHAETSKLQEYINYKPICNIDSGVKEMTDWFKTTKYE